MKIKIKNWFVNNLVTYQRVKKDDVVMKIHLKLFLKIPILLFRNEQKVILYRITDLQENLTLSIGI